MVKKMFIIILISCLFLQVCLCYHAVAVEEDLLTITQMQKDIDFIKKCLVHHPMFYIEKNKNDILKKELEQLVNNIKEPKTKTEFFFDINKMFVSLGDAHTRLLYPHEQDMFINLPFRWLKDGVYINEKTSKFKVGDKIIKIGDKSIEQVFEYALSVFPHENSYYIEALCEKYVNYYFFLNYFNLINSDSTVTITFESNGKNKKCRLEFQQPVEKTDNNFHISWEIDKRNNLGYFRYDKCYFTDEYKNNHLKFFKEVRKSGVNNIVIDLRHNTGGYMTNVIYTIDFIKNVKSFWSYGTVHVQTFKDPPVIVEGRWNHEKAFIEEYTDDDKEIEFAGNLYVLIDNTTFSAANMSSFILKDNNFATLVGEPSGNKPTSYSSVSTFSLPESGFTFKYSGILVKRTDKTKNDDISLFPDIEVYTTVEDLKQGRDPQLEELYKLIKNCN